jgi:hypothetical protein
MTTPGAFLHDLDVELARASIPRALRARIVAEFADHLASDPTLDLTADPATALGEPRALARQFADELGTTLARRAATRAFAALALAGTLFVAALGSAQAAAPIGQAQIAPFAVLALLVCMFAGQVSFVSGGLGLVRAWRLRRAPVIPAAEAAVLARRAGAGLSAGAVTLLAPTILMVANPARYGGAHVAPAVAALVIGLLALGAATPGVVAAVGLRPHTGGDAGDLYSDLRVLAPVPLTHRCNWAFALTVAGALVFMITLVGILGDDPYDGAMRALLEGGACLAGFGLLGRYLGLRA